MTKEELNAILEKHKKWLNDESDGERANLSGACLSGAYLSGADLSGAKLSGAYLYRADLSGANLSGANLSRADLSGANLSCANLSGAYLSRAYLSGAYLSGANLYRANLSGACLSGAYLSGANLYHADLSGAENVNTVKWNDLTAFFNIACPESGSFIGWKRAGKYIVKLRITEDAKRSSATSRKCRCSKAEVLSIETIDGEPANVDSVPSDHDSNFIYKVGETVEVTDFCVDRWKECAEGIHFFITRAEAVNYQY